jgi:hypothetical protein
MIFINWGKCEEIKTSDKDLESFIKKYQSCKIKVIGEMPIITNKGNLNKYLVLWKEADSIRDNKLLIYQTNSEITEAWQDTISGYFPFSATRIYQGFVITMIPGAGRVGLHLIFFDIEGKLKEVFAEEYDFIEFAYYNGYQGRPHLFCHTISYGSEYKFNRGIANTDIYNWDRKSGKYVLLHHIKYSKKLLFKDRFKSVGNESPCLAPLYWDVYERKHPKK